MGVLDYLKQRLTTMMADPTAPPEMNPIQKVMSESVINAPRGRVKVPGSYDFEQQTGKENPAQPIADWMSSNDLSIPAEAAVFYMPSSKKTYSEMKSPRGKYIAEALHAVDKEGKSPYKPFNDPRLDSKPWVGEDLKKLKPELYEKAYPATKIDTGELPIDHPFVNRVKQALQYAQDRFPNVSTGIKEITLAPDDWGYNGLHKSIPVKPTDPRGKSISFIELTPSSEGSGKITKSFSPEENVIATLMHELQHRGQKLTDKNNGNVNAEGILYSYNNRPHEIAARTREWKELKRLDDRKKGR
jgi:hypothetical protein